MRFTVPILINCLLVLCVYLADKQTPFKKLCNFIFLICLLILLCLSPLCQTSRLSLIFPMLTLTLREPLALLFHTLLTVNEPQVNGKQTNTEAKSAIPN